MRTNPYPLFGGDNYSYLHTVLRYNGIKAGYDIKILSFKYPEYEPILEIGIQSKIRQKGTWEKYTSLLTPGVDENLAFQIMVPVKANVVSNICAELYPYPYGENVNNPCQVPVAWFNETGITAESESVRSSFGLPGQNGMYDYRFVSAELTNEYQPGKPSHVRYQDNNFRYEEGNEEQSRTFQEVMVDDFNINIPSANQLGKIFVLRVQITTLDANVPPTDFDFREDSIILEIKPG